MTTPKISGVLVPFGVDGIPLEDSGKKRSRMV